MLLVFLKHEIINNMTYCEVQPIQEDEAPVLLS